MTYRLKALFLMLIFIFDLSSLAYGGRASVYVNYKECADYFNTGLFRKYKYQAPGDTKVTQGGNFFSSSADISSDSTKNTSEGPLSEGTKKQGSTKTFTDSSTENSTAVTDPLVWSHATLGLTYATLSSGLVGPCKRKIAEVLKEQREIYFTVNKDEVFKEISKGRGENLMALADLTVCDPQAYSEFNMILQKNLNQIMKNSPLKEIDHLVISNPNLKKSCLLSSIN